VKINILTYLARQEKDNIDYDEALEARVQNVELVNAKARYHQSCLKNFYYPLKSDIVGRPLSESSNDVIQFIIDYIEENENVECQFSLYDLLKKCPIKEQPKTEYNRKIKTLFL